LSLIPGIRYGFGNRDSEAPMELLPYWSAMPVWNQVAGTAWVEVTTPKQDCGDVDAFFTTQPELPIAIRSADCIPVLLARRDGKMIACAHAGWRGTQGRIVKVLWEALAARGAQPKDWVGVIGPGIGRCCYEVSEELADDFNATFANAGAPEELAVPHYRHLDLPGINAWELRNIGFTAVEDLHECTKCAKADDGEPIYESYRRDRGEGRQFSGLVIL